MESNLLEEGNVRFVVRPVSVVVLPKMSARLSTALFQLLNGTIRPIAAAHDIVFVNPDPSFKGHLSDSGEQHLQSYPTFFPVCHFGPAPSIGRMT
jgi:hypothetical protein